MTVAVMTTRARRLIRTRRALANWYIMAGLNSRRHVFVEELSDKTLVFKQI